MLFSSFEFLFLFLPLFFAVYLPVRRGAKNLILFLFSLIFYAFGEPVYVFLMLFTITANYCFGFFAARRRGVLVFAVATDLLLLGFFKYADFFAGLFGFPAPGIPLPIGISFYTFQALSYVIDVYRGAPARRDYIGFGAYITMFPQLIAGPIVRYGDVSAALDDRRMTLSGASRGIGRFIAGLAKKAILANAAGQVFEYFRSLGDGERGVLGAWLGLFFFAFQIYFDFSGYSDMALGLGAILGFDFPENFNYPYTALGARDFWRRWHISLSVWFREYLYIPLGGNRRGKARTFFNLFCVWALTGFWHGAAVNFLLWGIYWFFLLALERSIPEKYLSAVPRVLRHALSLFFILIGWCIFAFDDFRLGSAYFLSLFSGRFFTPIAVYEFSRNAVLLLLLGLGSTPLPKKFFDRFCPRGTLRRSLAPIPLFLLSAAYLADSSYNPFLYFRF